MLLNSDMSATQIRNKMQCNFIIHTNCPNTQCRQKSISLLKILSTYSERVSISAHTRSVITVTRLDVFLCVFHISAVDTNLHDDDEPAT